ncbi:hypothetical protein RB593_000061 [Gaeumannomyces tritici]
MAPSLATAYRDSMRRHRFGYALHEPALFTRLRPGMLGYLDDEYQRWHPILDLADEAAVSAAGYGPLLPGGGQLRPSEPDARRMGPLKSERVAETTVELGTEVSGLATAGLPVDVGGAVRYSSSGGFGAVLLCGGDVVSEGFDFRDPFRAWIQRHAKALFAAYPDAKKHGLCAATWTYSSVDVGIATWEDSKGSAVVGFKVGVAGVAKVEPKVSWTRGASTGGWAVWKDQKRVVFFSGVRIKPGLFGSTREQPEKDWRGADDAFFVEDEEGGSYRVGVEEFGDDWGLICNDGVEEEEPATCDDQEKA